MRGPRDALIREAELRVVVNQAILAGEHQAFPALPARRGDDVPDEHGCKASSPALRHGVDAEDHLPGALFIVHGGIVIHLIPEVRLIGREPVDEPDDCAAVLEDPEMIRINPEPRREALSGGALRGREAERLNLRNSLKISHGRSPYSQLCLRHLSQSLQPYTRQPLRRPASGPRQAPHGQGTPQ